MGMFLSSDDVAKLCYVLALYGKGIDPFAICMQCIKYKGILCCFVILKQGLKRPFNRLSVLMPAFSGV